MPGRVCNCGRLLKADQRYCDTCRPKENRPNSTQRGYDNRWRKTRARHLAAHPDCEQCGAPATDVDHIDGLGPLGPAGHEPSNLRSLCHSHHSQRTARDQPAGSLKRGPYYARPFTILRGPSGAGKTTIRQHISNHTGVTVLGPDDFPNRWEDLLERLDQTEHALVECVRIHSGLRRRAKERGAIVIDLTAPTWMLRDRLDRRGEDAQTIQRRIDQTFEPAYDSEIEADLELDTSHKPPEEIAAAAAGFMEARGAS